MGEHHVPVTEAGARPGRLNGFPVLSVAPMLDVTDRHFRRLVRGISRHVLLYTEMVTEQALRFGPAERLLAFSDAEQPLVLQLGGSDPDGLAEAVRLGFEAGYSAVNLNVGCPSERVRSGSFGACLMLDPVLTAELAAAMRSASPLPVTVKHRIGVDDRDSYGELLRFVDTVAAAGVSFFTVHARKAWLSGLSPKENRNVPPLDYGAVGRLVRDRPGLSFELNGGVRSLEQAGMLLRETGCQAVMLGRAVRDRPWVLAGADREFFGAEPPAETEVDAVRAYLPYLEDMLTEGVPLRPLLRPLLGMFAGTRGARGWRRELSEGALQATDGPALVAAALANVAGSREAVAADAA